MGKIVTITSGKGGVGKSTTTANLSSALATLGKKVVAVDFDIGLRNLDMILGLENRVVYDVVDVMEGNCNLAQAVIKDKKVEGLHFIPASQTKDKTILDKEKVQKLLEDLKKEFEYSSKSSRTLKVKSKHWFFSTLNLSRGIYKDVLWASLLINLFVLATPLFTMNVYDRVVPNSAFETLWVLRYLINLLFPSKLYALELLFYFHQSLWHSARLTQKNHPLFRFE